MFDDSYRATKLAHNKTSGFQPEEQIYYNFITEEDTKYQILVERYRDEIYILKFHLKRHKKSKNKYSYLTNTGHASKVIRTVISVGLEILEVNKNASFGFVGAHKITKSGLLEPKNNTCRYRIYRRYCISSLLENFTHFQSEEHSAVLLVNKCHENPKEISNRAASLFADLYNEFN